MEQLQADCNVSGDDKTRFSYAIMHYKKSGKYGLRRKGGNQLFVHRSVTVIREAWLKLWFGADEAEVTGWVRSQ